MKVRELMEQIMDSMRVNNLLDQELDERRYSNMRFRLSDGRKIEIESYYYNSDNTFKVEGRETLDRHF